MMNREELAESFEDACKGDRVLQGTKDKLSRRLDLHAMMLLDRLVPGTINIIACAEHDQVWLNVDLDELCKVLTPELITELVSCGVLYDADNESLYMFA